MHIKCSVRNCPHPAQEETPAGTRAHLLELGPVAPLASLTDHEEQATLTRRRQLASLDTHFSFPWPCKQHHHGVHVDDGDPANRLSQQRLPLTARKPLKPLSEATFRHQSSPWWTEEKKSWQQKEHNFHARMERVGSLLSLAESNSPCQPHRKPVRTLEECWRRLLHQQSPMAEHLLKSSMSNRERDVANSAEILSSSMGTIGATSPPSGCALQLLPDPTLSVSELSDVGSSIGVPIASFSCSAHLTSLEDCTSAPAKREPDSEGRGTSTWSSNATNLLHVNDGATV